MESSKRSDLATASELEPVLPAGLPSQPLGGPALAAGHLAYTQHQYNTASEHTQSLGHSQWDTTIHSKPCLKYISAHRNIPDSCTHIASSFLLCCNTCCSRAALLILCCTDCSLCSTAFSACARSQCTVSGALSGANSSAVSGAVSSAVDGSFAVQSVNSQTMSS